MKKLTCCPQIILLLWLCFGFTNLSSAQNKGYNIRGSVYNASTQQPLKSVMVSLKTSPSNANITTVYTDSLGNYFCSTREAPPFIVQAFTSGFKTEISEPFTPNNERMYTVKSIYMQSTETEIHVAQPKIVPTPNYVESKFISLDVLPTKGAYDLFYALNPELKNMDSVSTNYQYKAPHFPQMKNSTRVYFKKQYKIDKEKNKVTQQELLDSIAGYDRLYMDLISLPKLKYANEASSKKLLQSIHEALNGYQKKIKKTRNAHAIQIINLTSASSDIIQKCIKARAVTNRDFDKLKNILEDLSILLPSDEYNKLIASGMNGHGHGGTISHIPLKYGSDIINKVSGDELEDSEISDWNMNDMRGLRSFAFVIWKMKDGEVILEGPEVTERYFVYYFPPALEDDTFRYHKCDPAASYAQVSLPKARFGIYVVDSLTGLQVETSDKTFNTQDAFRSGINLNLGGTNYKRIIIQVIE